MACFIKIEVISMPNQPPANPPQQIDAKQIGNYATQDTIAPPPTPGLEDNDNPLYKGSEEYNEDYEKNVLNFLKKQGIKSTPEIEESIKNRTFFREQFLQILEKVKDNGKNSEATAEQKKENPKKHAISMEELLGKKGSKLYKLALEEEFNSKQFMDSVLAKSTLQLKGESWAQRPVVIVGGPSGSGKTTAAEDALKKASEFIPKDKSGQGIDKVVFADGGIGRKVSQMRKTVLKIANNKGYTGISDLHEKSKILGRSKKRVYEFALNHTNYGLVIPETFSAFRNPNDKSRKILKDAVTNPDVIPIFTRVDGDPARFQNAVTQMASSRAWKTDGFDKQDSLDLNADPSCESKSYAAGGYYWGVEGSKLAEEWFEKNSPQNLRMLLENDLLLKRKVNDQWVDAKPGDEGAIIVSNRVFKEWNNLRHDPNIPDLGEYAKAHRVGPIIQTSEEIQAKIKETQNNNKVDAFRRKLAPMIKELESQIGKPKRNITDDQLKIHIARLGELSANSVKDPAALMEFKRSIDETITKLPQHAKELRLADLSKMLDDRIKELATPEKTDKQSKKFSQSMISIFRRDTARQDKHANDQVFGHRPQTIKSK